MAITISRYDPAIAYNHQKSFDCGHQAINGFVVRSLKQQVQRNLSAAYVLTDDDTFVGFCTLMAASIGRAELAATSPPSLPAAVPVTKLSMLGVAKSHSRQGLGRQLLRRAIQAMLESSRTVGTYGLYLDADDGAYEFYVKLGFVPLKARQAPNPTPMFLPLVTARQAVGATAG